MTANATQTPLPKPQATELTAGFWSAAENGDLAFMRCQRCQKAFLPAREECPECLEPDLAWERASGQARLISWVVYHRAFHPAFEGRVPYTVAVVELTEGARMISNIVGVADPEKLKIDQPLVLTVEQEDGVAVPRFTPASTAD